MSSPQGTFVTARGGFLPGGLGVALTVVVLSLIALAAFIVVERRKR